MINVLGLTMAAVLLLTVGCVPMALHEPTPVATVANFAANDDYLRQHEAPDYRILAPFYTHQTSPASCSAASTAMVINALRTMDGHPPFSLVTEADVVATTGEQDWARAVAPGGDGVSFSAYLHYLRMALDAFGLGMAQIDVFRAADASPETRRQLSTILAESEKSGRDVILAVFDQGTLLAGEHVGHISPVAAYDDERGAVLVLDVDVEPQEPYWTSMDRLVAALLYPDASDASGDGMVRIRLPDPIH